ncbi:hypothetical protein [Paraburkholderia tropica]|uniref:hypothetical protein n=1 Tax=Paraburkholderia tropica TaxID=92647 RepID=UPI000F51B767|nr:MULTISPECIES: hypothetical protein [Paraburkholderia]RQM43902.1 hypothetical protein EHZ19_31635 [Paraburkholderia bannensis]
MKKEARDLLGDLVLGRITPEEAEAIYDWYMDNLTSDDPPVTEMLGFSKIEWTAHAHGAEFQDIANWRAHGWPNRCFICGQPINVEKFGWFTREHEGRMQLRHITCPK